MAFETLGLAASLLRSSRINIDVASRNLAGSNEAGYTRQSATTVEQHPSPSPHYAQEIDGLGVQVQGVFRSRTALLDQNFRLQSQDTQELEAGQSYLQDLETQLSGPNNLSQRFSEAAQGLATLQTQADNIGLRQNVLQNLQDVTESMRATSSRITDIGQQAHTDLSSRVDRANQILDQLSQLNPRIVASATGTMGRNGQLDERDKLVDELSGLMDVKVAEQPNGSVNLYADGAQVLFGSQSTHLQLQNDNSLQTALGRPVALQGGAIKGLQDVLNVELPAYQQQMDTLASQVIGQLNAVHQNGYGLDGVSGRSLLSGTSAKDIGVAIQDPRYLAAAVARIDGNPIATSAVAPDQTLLSQTAKMTQAPAASGVISINGQNVAWDSSQSLNQILTNISATGVTARFDSQSQRILVARNTTVAGAASIAISDVSGNLSQALGLSGIPSVPGGPSDNAGLVALQKGLSSKTYGSPADRSFEQATRDVAVGLGQNLASRSSNLSSAQAGLDAAKTTRQNVTGVSSDEELIQVQKQQQAFAAAARIANVANEMLTTIVRDMF